MKKSLLGMSAALIFFCGCSQKQEAPKLTLSGLDPANFETLVDSV